MALAASTIWLIASAVLGNNPSTAVSALATVASGGGLAFIVKQKNDAAKAMDTAYSSVKLACKIPVSQENGPFESRSTGGGEGGLPDYAIAILGGQDVPSE